LRGAIVAPRVDWRLRSYRCSRAYPFVFRGPRASRWPFWLLIAAWVCANTPQIAVFALLTWLAESRSFTHQQRLTQDVARLLVGEKPTTPIADTVARTQENIPSKPLPPVPADTVLKKLELSLEKTTELLPLALRATRYREISSVCPEQRRCAPPHGPPRALGLLT
jgi:hypothetical protein